MALPRRTLALPGQRQAALAGARQRLMVALLLFVAACLIIGLRLIDLAVLHEVDRGPVAVTDLPPRGDIIDRNGVELADTVEAIAATVAPRKLVGDPHVLARQLAAILPDKTVDEIYFELVHPGSFRYLSRRILPAQATAINALGEPAIAIKREPERLYPNLDLAAHVIGYTDIDGHGRYGMERAADAHLTSPATRGVPVQLALDSRVQQALESELQAAKDKFTALGAAGIVMDVHTGEILALASLPAFNPNAAGHSDDNSRFDRATLGVYELGSTFKTFTIAMSVNDGLIKSMAQKYDATAPIHIGRFTIHDDPDGHELRRWATVPDIFIHSSNIGSAHIAAELGATRQRAYLDALGFLKPVTGELMERGHTLYPPASNWGEVATMTIGFGHGLAVSPLHLAVAYSAVVNGGILHPATMLKVKPGQAVPGTRVFSQATSDTMRALLRMVVMSGTGRKANAPGYRVGGKTGTAEKQLGGHYEKHVNISTFAGAFPMDAPRYVVIAMLDAPHGTRETGGYSTAGQVTAPSIARIVPRIAPVLGVAPDLDHDVDVSSLLGLVVPEK